MKKYFQPEISIMEIKQDVICSSLDPAKGDIFGGNSLSEEGV